MNAIIFYTHQAGDEVVLEYNFYDNTFAPSNLVVRKILISMLEGMKNSLTHLEVEYNDGMIADKLGGKRAVELLRFLGATKENVSETKSGNVIVSRTFRTELTPERFDYFTHMLDVSELSHYRLLAGDRERIIFYFNQYLSLRCEQEEAERFFQQLRSFQIPFKLVPIS